MAPGESYDGVTGFFVPPSSFEGSGKFEVVTDFFNDQPESDDSNNSFSQSVQVNAGDFDDDDDFFDDDFFDTIDLSEGGNEVFTYFNPESDSPQALLDQITGNISGIEINLESVNSIGTPGSTSFFELINLGQNANLSQPGVLLTSGNAAPPLENTEGGYSIAHGSNGDPELTEIAQSAFSDAGTTNDVAILEFSFSVEDPQVQSISFDVLFGSEEFPEFIDSEFVDIAAITVNGQNFAFLDGNPNKPLSVVGATVEDGRFIDNTDGSLPIEYNGMSPQTRVTIPLDQVPANEEGNYDVRIGVADTGDFILDSGFFISNFQTSELVAGGTQVVIEAEEQGSELEAAASNTSTFFIAGPGNDTMTGSTAPDTYDLSAGGSNLVNGSLEQLDEDTIIGFSSDDKLKFLNALFDQDQLSVTQGSAILGVDADADGEIDSTVTLQGDFTNGEFETTQVDGGTEILFTATQVELQADLNQDGIVNLNDLGLFASTFGLAQGDNNFNAVADLTGDGLINLDDLGIFASEFGF